MTAAAAIASVSPIDALRRAPDGRYDDGRVVVRTVRGLRALRVDRNGATIVIRHGFDVIDDDLAEQLAGALAPLTDDADLFARAFTGIVLTTAADPGTAWERFYRATLDRTTDGTRVGYAEIYRHASTLLPRTSVLDLGAGFGFLALHLAGLGTQVTAADVDAGSQTLLAAMSVRLRLPVTVTGPVHDLPDRSVDAVALLHVLEHLDRADALDLVHEAVRVARHRVVIAVPYEAVATALYGHVRTIDAFALASLATRIGWPARVYEHHGGWLVLDRPVAPARSTPEMSIAGARRRAVLH